MTHLTTRDFPSLSEVFFKDFFGDDFFTSIGALKKKIPHPVDIYETKEGLTIDVAVVGLNKSDINIDVEDDVLRVSYEKTQKEEKEYAYNSISKKSFNLAWRIHDKFDLTKIQAGLDKGLLSIKIPLAEEKKPKKVNVEIQ